MRVEAECKATESARFKREADKDCAIRYALRSCGGSSRTIRITALMKVCHCYAVF